MTCRYSRYVSEYLDGELEAVAHSEMEQHLEACDECGAALVAYLGVRDYVRAEGPEMDRVEQQRRLRSVLASGARPRGVVVPVPAFAALVLALVAAVAFLVYTRYTPTETATDRGDEIGTPLPSGPAAGDDELSRFDGGDRPVLYLLRGGSLHPVGDGAAAQ